VELALDANHNDITNLNISTYGMWCGVSDFGDEYPHLDVFRFMRFLNRANETGLCVNVYIGTDPDTQFPFPRYLETARVFNNINFHQCVGNHTKCMVSSEGMVYMGSMNLTSSKWFEAGIFTPRVGDLKHLEPLDDMFDDIKVRSRAIRI